MNDPNALAPSSPAQPSMTTLGSDVRNAVLSWAESTPLIRRGWLFDARAQRSYRSDGDINIAIEVEPVGDSEETLVLWIANAAAWQSQLQEKTGQPLYLEWFDPDGNTRDVGGVPAEAAVLIYERLP